MAMIKAGTDNCELCGKEGELRPYGASGEWICFECGMKDEATTTARFDAILDTGLIIDLRDQDGLCSVKPT